MIFHILYFLQTTFPSYSFVADGELANDSPNRILIQETPGQISNLPNKRRDDQLQVRVQHEDQFEAKAQANAIFAVLRDRGRLALQPHPEDATGVMPITFARIAALQAPAAFGRLEDGTFVYINNYVLTYQG